MRRVSLPGTAPGYPCLKPPIPIPPTTNPYNANGPTLPPPCLHAHAQLARRIDLLSKKIKDIVEADEAETMTTYSVINRDTLAVQSRPASPGTAPGAVEGGGGGPAQARGTSGHRPHQSHSHQGAGGKPSGVAGNARAGQVQRQDSDISDYQEGVDDTEGWRHEPAPEQHP